VPVQPHGRAVVTRRLGQVPTTGGNSKNPKAR
jgi:hypothetical protein